MFDATQVLMRCVRENEHPRLLDIAKTLIEFLMVNYKKVLKAEDHLIKLEQVTTKPAAF